MCGEKALLTEEAQKSPQESEAREGIDADVREWEGILLSDIGTSSQRVSSGSLDELSAIEGGYVHTIVIPSNMSDNEKDAFCRRKGS